MNDQDFRDSVVGSLARIEAKTDLHIAQLAAHARQDEERFDDLHTAVGKLQGKAAVVGGSAAAVLTALAAAAKAAGWMP